MDIKNIISIRSKGINDFLNDNLSPEDVVFHVKDGHIGISLIPFKGDFPPSYKYDARKQVMRKILDGTISQEIANADEVFYCSYDNIYNVDYIFSIMVLSRDVTLFIVRDGKPLRRYQNYQLEYDERVDLANL